MKCDRCRVRRLRRNLWTLAVPVTHTMNYETRERQTLPVGAKVCRVCLRALVHDGEVAGARIRWGTWTAGGVPIFVELAGKESDGE